MICLCTKVSNAFEYKFEYKAMRLITIRGKYGRILVHFVLATTSLGI